MLRILATVVCALTTTLLLAAPPTPAPAKAPALTNAALATNGARVSLQMLDPQGGQDARTMPEDSADGNPHTRCVVWGCPYRLTFELVDRVLVTSIQFIQSDYATETAPRDVEVKLDDGTVLTKTLELVRPEGRNRFPRQALDVNRETRKVEITFTSTFPGENNWGGIGEVEILTSNDLKPLLTVGDFDMQVPAYIQDPLALIAKEPTPTVTLPPRAGKEHPRLLLTPADVAELRRIVASGNPRIKPAYDALIANANAACTNPIDFPDPKGPQGQMKDRGDEVAQRQSKTSRSVETLGMAYQLTGDRKYADRAREILLGYADRYLQYPLHRGVHASDMSRVMAQRLSEAMWLIPQIIGADCIWETLSEEDRTAIADKLIRPACWVILSLEQQTFAQAQAARDKAIPGWRETGPKPSARRSAVGNWSAFYNAAFTLAGFLLDDPELSDEGIFGVRQMILDGITPDGLWNEGAIGYQFFAMQAFMLSTEAAAHQGVDLYGFAECRLKQLFDSPMRYAFPDSTMPGIHDSGGVNLFSWSSMVYDFAYLRYGDNRYAAIINNPGVPRQLHASEGVYYHTRIYEPVQGPALAQFPSAIFNDVGYAILRQGAGDSQQYLLLDYGPHGGTHGHLDKLHYVYWADGEDLGGEPTMHRYEDRLHPEWTRQTLGHGSIVVDERSQAPCTGRLISFAPGQSVGIMRGITDGAYPGVALDRTLVLTADYVLDIHRARSPRPHTYDVAWELSGDLQGVKDPGGTLPRLGDRDGYQHVGILADTSTVEPWSRQWKTRNTLLTLTVAGGPQTRVVDGRDDDSRPLVMARREGAGAVAFVSVLQRSNSRHKVKSIEVLAELPVADGSLVKVTLDDGTVDIALVRERATDATLAGIHTDAREAFVRFTAAGKGTVASLVGGTFLSAGGLDLRAEAAGIASIQ
jgi:hypothetical protein